MLKDKRCWRAPVLPNLSVIPLVWSFPEHSSRARKAHPTYGVPSSIFFSDWFYLKRNKISNAQKRFEVRCSYIIFTHIFSNCCSITCLSAKTTHNKLLNSSFLAFEIKKKSVSLPFILRAWFPYKF